VKKAIREGFQEDIKGELRVKKGELTLYKMNIHLLNSPYFDLSELAETIAPQHSSPNSLNTALLCVCEMVGAGKKSKRFLAQDRADSKTFSSGGFWEGGGLKVCSTLAPDRPVKSLPSGGKNGRGVLMADKEIGK
jgi:hypothetical protein